jgi:hypothetical protein
LGLVQEQESSLVQEPVLALQLGLLLDWPPEPRHSMQTDRLVEEPLAPRRKRPHS